MSCGQDMGLFRLLDAYVGWEAGSNEGNHRFLVGLDDPHGLRLARKPDHGLSDAELATYMLPPRLARGCHPCDWYLLTPDPSRLMRRSACSTDWVPLWEEARDPCLVAPVALAAAGHWLAIADPGAGRIWWWRADGDALQAEIRLANTTALAFAAWGELLVLTAGSPQVLLFGPDGLARGILAALPPEAGRPERIAAASDCSVWLATRLDNGLLRLWRVQRGEPVFKPAGLEALKTALPVTGLRVFTDAGFCLNDVRPDGSTHACCYSWYGRPLDEAAIGQVSAPAFESRGQLLTAPIDSGKPRCRWHRVHVDADVPQGTSLAIAIATAETPDAPMQGDVNADPAWRDFPAGAPHRLDWQEVSGSVNDFLIDRSPGRFLLLRLRLSGDGKSTPVVRRVRLDFQRSTSLEFLPSVFRENPQAEDFTERFLSLFDASIGDLDRAIERFPAMLDPQNVPDEVLPWLGSFLDLVFDPAWEPDRRRAILRALPGLYRQRGTVAGLALAIKLVFDIDAVIQELPGERMWGALGRDAHLSRVRLFGKSRARMRLGSSPLGSAPLNSYGNPDLDPMTAGAHHFRVVVPPGGLAAGTGLDRLRRLVESQKPAHTLASIRQGGRGIVLGTWSAVGIDTFIGAPPAPVLGSRRERKQAGNIRLNRMSILRAAVRKPRDGWSIGEPLIVGELAIR